MSMRFRFRDIDWLLLGLAIAIAIIGVVEIYSTTSTSALEGQFKKQIYWLILSVVLALVISHLDYHFLLEQTPWLYVLSVLALGRVAGCWPCRRQDQEMDTFWRIYFPSVRVSQISYNIVV